MTRTWYTGEVIRIEQFSETTKRFWVKILADQTFDFEAGQFVTMDLPIGDKRLQRWRSYSIANAPDQRNILEFCVVNLEGGLGTQYLFDVVTVGSTLKFKGPDGAFTQPKKLDRTNVFISTGTGVAPFRSMMQDIKRHETPFDHIHLIFGTRYASGILYRSEFEELAQIYPRLQGKPYFKYSVALSRAESLPPGTPYMDVSAGYVHSLYLHEYADVNPNTHFYICGWSKMIDDAVANLIITMGYPKEQIHYELYG